MSAMYGSRTSVQSYSSNMDIGDTFKLYERRFGNIYEANQLYDLLKLKVAILPGGKDSKQGPIIIFPSDSGIHNVSEHDILQCLIYLGSIPSESSVRRCFSIIIDNQRKTLSNQLNFILSCCQKTFDDAVSDVYILEEPPSLNIDLNRNITSANLHVVTASQLRNIFDGRHLTPSLGGSMNYNHDDWLMLRMFVESYVTDARSVCSEFDVFSEHMSSSLFQATPSNLQNLWIDFTDMKRRAEDFIRKGDDFLSRNKSSSFESNEENEMIIVQKVTEVVRVVEEKLDGLERLWRRKDVEEQQKVGIDALEKEVNEVVEWILGPGDKLLISQVGIGRDYEGADELRKQHERLELKCLDSYGRYAELRHKVEAYVQYSTAEVTKAAELEAQRDYMDTVYRSFAKRLELRRNTVISAVKFHRLLEEIAVLLDEIRKRLNYKTDLDSVEDLLEILNELSEKLDFNYAMATREGLQLKDMLCLPVKNSYGQEVNINREPDIVHVENCLERLQADKEGIKEALEVKRLELKQFLQLKICDQNVEQAISWIRELDDLINNPDSQSNRTLKDLERFQEELGKGENTAKNSFDYGQEILKASLYLRRVLDLDLAPNMDQSNRLNEAWRNFSRGSNENAAWRTALAIFNRKSDEFLKAAEDMLANLDVIQNRDNLLKEYQTKKSNLDQNHRELQLTAYGLNERIQRPILIEHSDKNHSNVDNLQTAENIKIKIQKMKDQMNQLDRKWSSMSKNGYVPGRRRTSLEGSDTSSGSQPRRMDARSIVTNREVHDGSDRSNDDARAVNQMNEWLESHALKRIASTNDMGRTLESVEGFYEKHVEYLQDMKAQEHLYRGRQVRNFPQQWNVVQEIIKQRITLALGLIKFHLSYNKASEDMKRIERMIEGGTNENMGGSLRELEESEENMGRNADEFLDCVTNQTYKDEYLNVEQPKYFVRDILEQWKQKRNQLNRHLVATSMGDISFKGQQINDELTKLEDDFVKSSPSSRNMSALNNKMEELQSRISILRESYNNNNKTSSFVDPSHSSEVEVQLDALNLKFVNFKRLLQQASKLEIFNKDFLTSETISQNNMRSPQNNVYVVKPLQNTTAKKGESFKLTCWINASPAQKIQLRWLKDGILLDCNGDKHSSQYKDGQCDLIISDVSNEDSGRYSCVASDGQLAISTAELAVEASPSIKEPLKDVSAKEGEPVELSVKVVGNPIPTVQWFLNGKELLNSPDFQIFSKDGTHTLRISEVFDEDKGLYTVVIKNRYGELTDRARLKVSVGQPGGETKQSRSNNWSSSINNRSAQLSHTNANPSDNKSIPSGFIKLLTDKTSKAGEDIILECSLPLFPNPTKITWYKDGIEITRTIPSIRTSMQNGVCRLVIERADSSHSGKYICKVQLNDKLYETSMLLTVKDKYPARLSQSAIETNYSLVTINERKSDLSSGGDASFHVDPFESSLRTNDMPWKSIDDDSGFAVRSSSTPQFVKKLESSNLMEKSATTFACKVVGEPSPNIQWYHNGRLIRPSNKYRMKLNKDGECSLTVWDCNKEDAGHYTCCALNIVGRDVCSAELISEDANDIDTTSYVEPETLKKILNPKSTTKTEDVHAGVVEVLSEPSFSKSCITEVNVDEGETARIECKVYGHPVPDVTWYKNGKEIKRGGRYQMVLNQEGMHSLVIKLAQTSDAGVYTCRSHNKSGQATMDFNLHVEDVASKYQSKIHTLRNPAIVKTAEVVQPPPFLTGYTPVSMVFSDSTKLKMSSKQAELERNAINDISSHSLATRKSSSSPMPLDHFPPRFLVTPDPIKIEEGGHAKFWAKVSASPQATVTWSINGLDIFTSSRFNVYFDGLMHVLEIMKVKKFDDGTIKVSAHNYKGDVHHTVQLSVTDAVNLRSHLHPSTNDVLQYKKKSLPSIEDVTVKGGSTKDTREKNFTPDSAEDKINFPLDRYKAAIAKKEAKDSGTKDDDSNTESSFKSSRFSKERELFGEKSDHNDSSNKKNTSQDETDFEKVKEKSGVFSGIETTKMKESEHKNVTKFSRYDGYSETKGHKFDRKGVDEVIEESDDNIKSKTITKSDAKDEQETLSQSLKNEIKDFKFSTKGNGGSRDIPSKTEQNYSLESSYRNKSPEDFTKIEKKSKSPDVDGSKNDGGFYQESMKSTTMTETPDYKWKHHLDGEDAETADDQYKPSIGETFYRKEESDHKSIELSRQKTNIKSDAKLKDIMSEEQNSGMKIIPEDKARGGQKSKEPRHDYETETTYLDTKYKNKSDNDTDRTSKVEYNKKLHHPMKDDAHQSEINISTEEASTHEEKQIEDTQQEDPSISPTEEDRAREQKYISTLTEEITFKDVNNVPQKFSTRLVKTLEYSKTNSTKSSTKDKPENTDEHSPSKPPYTRHAMSEFQWDIRDDENQSDSQNVRDHYKKWREDASMEMSGSDHQLFYRDPLSTKSNGQQMNEYGTSYSIHSVTQENSPKNYKHSYSDKATGDHLEISNKGVQYDDTGRIKTREAIFSVPIEKSTTIQDIETTDEITVETKVTQVKTVSMQLSEAGDINLMETTQVQTDTDMKETKKTKEREELVVSHLVSNVTEVLDQNNQNISYDNQEEQNAVFAAEKYNLYSTWSIDPGVLIAVHSYEPDSDEVMSLHEGEKLEFLEENSEDWWFVRKFFDNRQGFVPSRLLQTKEEYDKNISDKIAQQIDRLDETLSTKTDGSDFPPQMMNLLSDVLVRDGEPASLECIVSGNPKPSITWFHNSRVIKPSPDFLQFYDHDYVCSLSIREVFPEDGGRYTMIAKNSLGIASSSAELMVVENEFIKDKEEAKVSESPILVSQPKHLVVDEGQTAMFTCRFQGKSPMKVTWFKDGKQISPSNGMKLDVIEEEDNFVTVELTLNAVVEGQMGRYRAVISNELGEAEALTSLVVKARPKSLDFKANLKKVSRDPDTNITFKQEKVIEERSHKERLHSHTEADSSCGSSKVIQHDFRSVLKPSHHY